MRALPPSSQTGIVVAGGATVDPVVAARLPAADCVIAADGGLRAARRLGLRVDLLIGDLDSVTDTDLRDASFDVERHPPDKDRTDLALALDRAAELGVHRLTVVSGGGGRLDHALGNLLVLASPDYTDLAIDAVIGDAVVTVVRGRRDLSGAAGDLLSLFAVGGRATGVTTSGLRYPLREAVLEPLSSLGISNELTGDVATVTVADGVLLAVQPGPEPEE